MGVSGIYGTAMLPMRVLLNVCCILFQSVLTVAVTWFRLVLGTQFYMTVCHPGASILEGGAPNILLKGPCINRAPPVISNMYFHVSLP